MKKTFENIVTYPLDPRITSDYPLLSYAAKLTKVAESILAQSCDINKSSGAVLGVTRREKNSPMYMVEFGDVDVPDQRYQGGKRSRYYEFCSDKARCLQDHPKFLSSRENGYLPEEQRSKTLISKENVPGGAIVVGDYIISISGVSHDPIDDEMVARSIVAAVNF